jgi:hypothetical protein
MRRRWFSMLAGAVMATGAATLAIGQGETHGLGPGVRAQVTGTQGRGLTVRAAPSQTSDPRIVLADGVQVQVLSISIFADGYEWNQINYAVLGVQGWAAADFLIAAPTHPGQFDRFRDGWGAHGIGLSVAGDGQATASWRVYRWCGPGVLLPCDSMEGDFIVNGGQVAMMFTEVDGDTARGQVRATTDPTGWPLGVDITLTLEPYGMAELSVADGPPRTLCGSRFATEAPREVRDSYPCGA